MPEDFSQTNNAPATEANAQPASAPTSATVAPVETTPPQSQPQSNADALTENQHGGKTGEGGVNDELSDYEAERAAYLNATSVEQIPAPSPAPAAPAQTQTEPENDLGDISAQPEADGRLAPMKIRPEDPAERQLMSEWKAAKANGYTGGLIKYAVDRTLAATPAPAVPAATPSPAETQPAASPQAEDSPVFQSIAEVHTEIQRLRAEQTRLQVEFNFAEAAEFQSKADALLVKIPELAAQFESTQTDVAQAAAAEWSASQARAKALFPDVGNPNSALEQAAAEVRAQWVANNHPLAHVNDSAVALYAEAATRIGIAPSSAAPAAPRPSVTPPSPVHRPALSPIISAVGAPAQPTPPPLDISQTPLEDYEKERAAFLGKPYLGPQFA